jgi:N-acetylornithine carbamoyltransferase
MQRFLDLADLSRDQVVDLIELARRLQARPEPQALAGKILGLLFMNPSLRTLSSFQAGMMRLGGTSFVVTPGQGTWNVETRTGAVMNGGAAEHVREAIPVLASYCDALGLRAFAEGKDLAADLAEAPFKLMASLCDKPFINLESAVNHPCQALADWKTMDDLGVPRGGRFVLSWVYHPRALPLAVPAAALHMAAQRGMEVVVLRPDGYALPEPIMAKARAAAEAVLRQPLADWRVQESWFAGAREDCHFMHCLPVRRNVAVADEVLDGPRSKVIREAANRMVVQMAVLYRLLKG